MNSVKKPVVAMMTIGDPREHEWNVVFKDIAYDRHAKMLDLLKKLPIDVVYEERLPRSIPEIKEIAARLKVEGAQIFLLHIACWTWPNLATVAVQQMDLPTILFANRETGTHAMVGLLGSGGALNQSGYDHIRIIDNYDSETAVQKLKKILLPMAKAAAAIQALRGSVFGMFGGRSLGIDTGTYDPMQWKRLFGIDCEHIDQLEIVRRAEMVEDARAQKMVDWLHANAGDVKYGSKFTPEKFLFQAKCYLATKDIVANSGIDFASIKCMPDLTANYTPQCLTAAFLPNTFDSEGEKEAIAMSCEADADAALSMQMLKLVSGGMPTMFADVSCLDPEAGLLYLPNCGAYTAWFAGRSQDATQNLQRVELREANRPAGGAITLFVAAPGPVTLARLTRKNGEYKMYLIKGEMIIPDDERHAAFTKSRGKHQLPMSYVKVDMDFDSFVAEFDSNHIAGVGMDCVEEIRALCRMLNIPLTVVG